MTATDMALDLGKGYIPLPRQDQFHRSTAKFRLYSGGYGSGKSLCGCREAIYQAFKYPGSSGLVGRLRMKDNELTTMKTFWEQLTEMGLNRKPYVKNYSAKLNTLTLYNGSEIIFSGLDDEMKLRSMQLSWAYVDEGSEVPDNIYRALMGRLRFGKPRRMWITTNPGASGYLRRNFVDNVRPRYFWVNAPTQENTYLEPDYIEAMLEEYPGVWRKRYLEGNWDAFEGQVFTTLDEGTHQVPIANWKPTPEHIIFEGWDFGFRNPTHVTWNAWHPSGEEPVITFAEHAASETLPPIHAQAVYGIRREWGLKREQILSYGDPAGAQVQGLTGLSYFDEYANHGIFITPSTKQPAIRAVRLGKLIDTRMKTRAGELPGWICMPQCQRTWKSIISLRYKENRSQTGEDPVEQFHKENDHGFDSVGYGIMPIWGKEEAPERKPPPVQASRPWEDDEDDFAEREEDSAMVTMYGVPV